MLNDRSPAFFIQGSVGGAGAVTKVEVIWSAVHVSGNQTFADVQDVIRGVCWVTKVFCCEG